MRKIIRREEESVVCLATAEELELFSRETLRALAIGIGVRRGADKSDTIRNLVAARAVAVKIELCGIEAVEIKADPDGYGFCPNCGQDSPPGTTRERRPDGDTRCGACHLSTPSRRWEMTKGLGS